MTWKLTATRREPAGSRRSRGLAATEFVIAVPVLILVALVLGEMGRAFLQYDRLSYFARNSARYVSARAIDGTTGVVDVGKLVAPARNMVLYGKTTPGADSEACVPGFVEGEGEHDAKFKLEPVTLGGKADYFRLTVEYPYHPIIGAVLPTFDGGPLDIDAMRMRVVVTMRAIS